MTLSRTIQYTARALAALLLVACAPGEPKEGRGAGLADAHLPAAQQAQTYRAALGVAFDFGPALSLLLDPSHLPRGTGLATGEPVTDSLRHAMLATGAIQGTCTPEVAREQHAPVCDAPIPGYVVRVSDVYRVTPDTLQLHVLVRRYDTRMTAPHAAFAFEEIYQLVRRDDSWRVARKARLARAD